MFAISVSIFEFFLIGISFAAALSSLINCSLCAFRTSIFVSVSRLLPLLGTGGLRASGLSGLSFCSAAKRAADAGTATEGLSPPEGRGKDGVGAGVRSPSGALIALAGITALRNLTLVDIASPGTLDFSSASSISRLISLLSSSASFAFSQLKIALIYPSLDVSPLNLILGIAGFFISFLISFTYSLRSMKSIAFKALSSR